MQYFTFIVPLLFWATFSHASPVTWEINAAITKLNPDMVGYANIGDVITLRYTFENTTPDIEPSVIERGKYDNAVTSASILLNDDQAQLENVGYITILNDSSNGEDVYVTSSTSTTVINKPLPEFGGFTFAGYGFIYKDNEASMFSNTNLTNDPILAGFDSSSLILNFHKPYIPNVFLGSAIIAEDLISITRITAVPLPTTFWLFLSGVIYILGITKRQQHTR